MNLSKCRNISVYLGGNCNFACQYCDRAKIKEAVGYSQMAPTEAPAIARFVRDVLGNEHDGELMMSFFGGEPFVFVKTMDEVIRLVLQEYPKMRFLVQTNGELILKNKDFIERWNKHLHISISYDFAFQGLNRTEYDIDSTLAFIKPLVNHVQLQYVMPVNRPDCFTVDKLAAVVRIFERYQPNRLSLIPLRHLRGPDRFKTFIDDVPLQDVFVKMLQWIQLLHLYRVPTLIDGMISGIEKSYFADHKQLVIAPDGYLYPEFDFVEYKVEGARIGEWRDRTVVERVKDDSHLIHTRCQTCEARNKCGIKYLYKMWANKPDEHCLDASKMYELLIRHNFALMRAPNLLELVGIQQ
jgi:radical SAM protein with 4Fe4S-binding SPASM domain